MLEKVRYQNVEEYSSSAKMSKEKDRKCEFNDLDNNIYSSFIATITKGDVSTAGDDI